jgi:hypothetical protein
MAIEKVPVSLGVMPSSVDEGWRLANIFAKSDLPPKNFRNHPEDILVAMQIGAEIGLPPMQALQGGAVINGRYSLWGDAVLALIVSSPLYQDHDEYFEVGGQRRDGLVLDDLKADTTTAICSFVRRGKATPVVRRFSVGQAKKAGLWSKPGPWQEYPDRMLAMRARGFAARDAFPDLLRGIHTAEEARDMPTVTAEPQPQPRLVQRLSERRVEPTTTVAEATTPPADTTTLGPLTVTQVEQLLGGACATLADGVQVWVGEPDDVKELAKFVGTDHALTFTVVRELSAWRLVPGGFAIAH